SLCGAARRGYRPRFAHFWTSPARNVFNRTSRSPAPRLSAYDQGRIIPFHDFADDAGRQGALGLERLRELIDLVRRHADEQSAGSLRVVEKLQSYRVRLTFESQARGDVAGVGRTGAGEIGAAGQTFCSG